MFKVKSFEIAFGAKEIIKWELLKPCDSSSVYMVPQSMLVYYGQNTTTARESFKTETGKMTYYWDRQSF